MSFSETFPTEIGYKAAMAKRLVSVRIKHLFKTRITNGTVFMYTVIAFTNNILFRRMRFAISRYFCFCFCLWFPVSIYSFRFLSPVTSISVHDDVYQTRTCPYRWCLYSTVILGAIAIQPVQVGVSVAKFVYFCGFLVNFGTCQTILENLYSLIQVYNFND